MILFVGGEIGSEIYVENDQFFCFEVGYGKVVIDGNEYEVVDGDVIIVLVGVEYNVINIFEIEMLKFYIIYSLVYYKDGIICVIREEVEENEEDFDGVIIEIK